MLHPRKDEHGKPVTLKKPSQPSPLEAWWDNKATACVVPDGDMPDELFNIRFTTARDLPSEASGWEQLANSMVFDEPPFNPPGGLKPAAGVIIRERDGRIWLVAPSNQFAGYVHTFPKGRPDGKSLKAAALLEAFEESGLQVYLTDFLIDVPRSLSYTRYYMAERMGGNPADMGWESQAVLLAPVPALSGLLTNANDLPILKALQHWLDQPQHRIMPTRVWDWKTLPMPAQQIRLPLDFMLTPEQSSAIQLGFLPTIQDEKWFACYQDNTLFQYRSWTGFCIDQIHFEPDGEGLRATHAIVNRDPEQYPCTDDREDAERVEWMVSGLAKYNINRLREAGAI